MDTKMNRRFHAVLGTYGIAGEERSHLIYSHTRKTSARLLSNTEAEAIVRAVERAYQGGDEAVRDKLRKRVIAVGCKELNWTVAQVKAWAEKYGALGEKKSFNAYSAQELVALRKKLKQVVASYIEQVNTKGI